MTIRLLIADDHEAIREGLRYTFRDTEIRIVAEAATGVQAVHLALMHDLDVAFIDLRMPDGDGFDVLKRIKAAKASLPVLVFSTQDRVSYVRRVAELGAAGYVLKGTGRSKLLDAIRRAHRGESLWDAPQVLTCGPM